MSTAIAFDNFQLVYDKLTVSYVSGSVKKIVLKEFSFKVERGKFIAIVGPSGCGKSTLLNATAKFIKEDSGTILLDGQAIKKSSLDIGFVFQNYALFDWLTVEENIGFGLKFTNLTKSEKKVTVEKLLRDIGLIEQRKYYPAELSGGMQQRVALARSIAPKPKVLLLDEPFAALDTDTKIKMRELLLQLWRVHGTTILFVTHDLEEALFLADRVVIIQGVDGIAGTIDVSFPRPREFSIVYTTEFRGLVENIANKFRTLKQSTGP